MEFSYGGRRCAFPPYKSGLQRRPRRAVRFFLGFSLAIRGNQSVTSQLFTFIEQIRSPDAALAESGVIVIHSRIALRFIRATCLLPAHPAQEYKELRRNRLITPYSQ